MIYCNQDTAHAKNVTLIKEKIVYMPWIAAKLSEYGFEILRVEANPHKPQFNRYVFEESQELLKAFTKISNMRK